MGYETMREIKDDPNVLDVNKWTDGVFSDCDKEGCNLIKWEEDVAQEFRFESAEFGGSIVNPDGDIKEGVHLAMWVQLWTKFVIFHHKNQKEEWMRLEENIRF